MFNFEKLSVYRQALELVDRIYNVTGKWPNAERYGLADQLRRAAYSIVLNIAEGSSRKKRDFAHYLDVAKGSCYECVAIITIARNRKFLSSADYGMLYSDLDRIAKMISGLKRSLRITNN